MTKIRTSLAIIHVVNFLFPPHFGRHSATSPILTAEERCLLQDQLFIGQLNFFCGRINNSWIDYQQQWLLSKATRWKPSAKIWACKFVKAVLTIAWNIWRDRCEYLHADDHPWKLQDRDQVIQSIRRLQATQKRFILKIYHASSNLAPPVQLTPSTAPAESSQAYKQHKPNALPISIAYNLNATSYVNGYSLPHKIKKRRRQSIHTYICIHSTLKLFKKKKKKKNYLYIYTEKKKEKKKTYTQSSTFF